MSNKSSIIALVALFAIVCICVNSVAAEDKGDTIILGVPGWGWGGGGAGGGGPNVIAGDKKGDVIIIGPSW